MNPKIDQSLPHNVGRVSVIMPARNRIEFLQEAVSSVASQSYQNIELIVIDDGSDPPIEQVALDTWCTRRSPDDLIIKRISEGNGNRARNAGIALATGQFIQFMDSDDLLDSKKIECQAERLHEDLELDGVICQVQLFDGNGRSGLWRSQLQGGIPTLKDFIGASCDWQTMAPLWRRRLFDAGLRWDPEISCHQDWVFHLHALSSGARLLLDFKVLAFYRMPEEGHVSWNMSDPVKLQQRIVVHRRSLDLLRRAGIIEAEIYRHQWWRIEQTKSDAINRQDFEAYFDALWVQFHCDKTLRGQTKTVASFLKVNWLLMKICFRRF
ncbi:glycosyl transferase family 2 [Prosthecobacter fusiformis]|uniref:Glycosyl transferase family 2 n=1 Tax=Prosthecobacter fusiformis TaxID=48464 RepID=A0A4R7RZJ0_9BACT|nr:glycosyltransferase family A protein [Prosthecobacter fusiformis]TDU71390.1 glycosyl transferase family 2 [Prosthecobacter fusiformis]